MAKWNPEDRTEESDHPYGELTEQVVRGKTSAEEAASRVSVKTTKTIGGGEEN